MAFTPSLIGRVTGSNVASLSISVPGGGEPAGSLYVLQGTSGSVDADFAPNDSTIGTTYALSSMVWDANNGGEITVVASVATNVTALSTQVNISGATNTGSGGNAAVNGWFFVIAFTDSQHFVLQAQVAAGVIGTIAGSPVMNQKNLYVQVAGSNTPSGSAQARVFQCVPSLALAHNDTISLAPGSGTFSGQIAGFNATGLNEGTIVNSSAGVGSDTHPIAAIPSVAANNYCLGFVVVVGPSTDGYTQAAGFSNLGNFNTQSTANVSVYAGLLQQGATPGKVTFNPTLGVSRDYVALLISITP